MLIISYYINYQMKKKIKIYVPNELGDESDKRRI